MRTTPVAGNYLDASATAELALPLSVAELRSRLEMYQPLIVLPMCHVAAVMILKDRFNNRPHHWNELATGIAQLTEQLSQGHLSMGTLPLEGLKDRRKAAESLAERHNLDIVDALQLVDLKRALEADPSGTLITTSDQFEKAAVHEGMKVWNCVRDSARS